MKERLSLIACFCSQVAATFLFQALSCSIRFCADLKSPCVTTTASIVLSFERCISQHVVTAVTDTKITSHSIISLTDDMALTNMIHDISYHMYACPLGTIANMRRDRQAAHTPA